jgi:hypothetical protein
MAVMAKNACLCGARQPLQQCNTFWSGSARGIVLLQDLPQSRTRQWPRVLPSFHSDIRVAEHGTMGTIMKLHLISGAVLLYTVLTLVAICLAELGSTPQNMPF